MLKHKFVYGEYLSRAQFTRSFAAGIADLRDQLTMAAGALFTLKQRSANERESIAKLITIFAT